MFSRCTILAVLQFYSLLNAVLLAPTAIIPNIDYYGTNVNFDFQYDSISCTNSKTCYIYCSHIQSCEGLSINADGASQLVLYCSSNKACATLALNSSGMNDLQIICAALNACQNMKINAKNVNSSSIFCYSSTYACQSAVIDIQNSTAPYVVCWYKQACYNAQFILDYSTEAYVLCDSVIYGGGSAATSPSYAACYMADITARYVSQIVIGCTSNYDCYGSTYNFSASTSIVMVGTNYSLYSSIIHTSNVQGFYLLCNGSYACNSTTIYGYGVQTFSIGCSGNNACYNTQIYCPTNYACGTNCSGSNACYAADFYIADNSYRDFQLYCNLSSSSTCSEVNVHCIDTGKVTTWALNDNQWGCNGDWDCCPLENITTAPTAIPTVLPTYPPTSMPITTASPTALPTPMPITTASPTTPPTTTTIANVENSTADGISGSDGTSLELDFDSLSIYIYIGVGLIVVCVILTCIYCYFKKPNDISFVVPRVPSVDAISVPPVMIPQINPMMIAGQQPVAPVMYVAVAAPSVVLNNALGFGGAPARNFGEVNAIGVAPFSYAPVVVGKAEGDVLPSYASVWVEQQSHTAVNPIVVDTWAKCRNDIYAKEMRHLI